MTSEHVEPTIQAGRTTWDLTTTILIVAALLAGLLAASAPVWWWVPEPPTWQFWWFEVGTWLSLMVAGLLAAARPKYRRIARLILGAAIAYGLSFVAYAPSDLLSTAGYLSTWIWLAMTTHAALTFPSGRLAGRLEAVAVVAAYATTIVSGFAYIVFYAPDCAGCPRNVLLLQDDPALDAFMLVLINVVGLGLTTLIGLALARRWRSATGAERHILAPAHFSFVAIVAAVILGLAIDTTNSDELSESIRFLLPAAFLLLPVGLVVALLRDVVARSAVGGMLVRLGHDSTPLDVERELAAALHDPTARLALRKSGETTYLAADGRPIEFLPSPTRMVTVIEEGGDVVVAVEHDVVVARERAEVLGSAIAAARLALANQRLAERLRRRDDRVDPADTGDPRAIDIFISYRREDTAGDAGRLYDSLRRQFGAAHIFMDVDTMKAGDDFVSALEVAVARCDVLLAVIGRQWLTVTAADGSRRLDGEVDFVRLEIATALQRGKHVIPLLVSDARMPTEAELPESLKPLTRRVAMTIRHSGFRTDVAGLRSELRRLQKQMATDVAPHAVAAEDG